MKVGLLSKLPHCKPHVDAIRELGFQVKKLGPSPTSIPQSVDILVVRVDSVSHGGDAVARKWARSTKKPVVYENGVSGIRRELSAMVAKNNNLRTPPSGVPWSEAFSDDQFVEAYREVKEGFVQSPEATGLTNGCKAEDFDWKEFTYKVEPNFKWHGQPVHSLIFFYLNFHKGFVPYKRDVNKVYKALTGKSINTATMCLVAWYLHFDPPVNAPRGGKRVLPPPVEPGTEKGVEIVDLSGQPEGIRSPDRAPERDLEVSVDSNTQAILEVMDDLSTFKKEIRAEVESHINRAHGHMAAGIKALEERVAFRLDQTPDSDLETRIKALELGASETLRQAQTGARMAVEAMGEELRSDISNAFDALAAEQPSGDVSPNPLAALEQVKAALKAAGFTGTLTLTIE